MRHTRFLLLAVASLLLLARTSWGVEALTSSAYTRETRSRAIQKRMTDYRNTRDALKVALAKLQSDQAVLAVLADPGLPPSDVLSTLNSVVREGLSEPTKSLLQQLQQTAEQYVAVEASLAQAEYEAYKLSQKPELKSLTITPAFQITTGNASASFVPSIEASGSFFISSRLDGQVIFSLKPDPPAGTAAEVTQSIRVNTGVLAANLGINYHWFWSVDPDPDSPQGLEIRAGIPVAYQRSSVTDTTSQTQPGDQSAGATADFGLLSPEIKLSLWLKYALVGYKYSYHIAFGNSTAVYDAINKSGAHKVYIALRVDALSGANTPFYTEATYSSGRNTFGGGSFSLAFSKSLSWGAE